MGDRIGNLFDHRGMWSSHRTGWTTRIQAIVRGWRKESGWYLQSSRQSRSNQLQRMVFRKKVRRLIESWEYSFVIGGASAVVIFSNVSPFNLVTFPPAVTRTRSRNGFLKRWRMLLAFPKKTRNFSNCSNTKWEACKSHETYLVVLIVTASFWYPSNSTLIFRTVTDSTTITSLVTLNELKAFVSSLFSST